MDNELGKNDPYRNMETAQDEVRPEFLNSVKGKAVSAKEKVAQGALKAAEVAAATQGVPVGGPSKGKTAAEAEEQTPNLFTGSGKKFNAKKGKFKIAKISVAVVLVFGLVMMVAAVALIGGPIFMIGNIDYNLQDALGFTGTVGILEKQAEYVVDEDLALGKVPDALAGDFAARGLMVGQVTASGDFVRTNTYVANVEELKDLAVLGHYQMSPSNGELAILYKDRVIAAGEFATVVESNPEMYAAYSEALDISAKYYYSDEADKVFQDFGISRGAFADWNDTGDEEKNQESFNEILEKVLNNKSSLTVEGVPTESSGGEGEENVGSGGGTVTLSDKDNAAAIVDEVAAQTTGSNATEKAAQLLNAAISAGEPYLAANAFMAIEEPIQRARVDGGGPVNEVMNLLNEESEVSYTNVRTGETKKTKNAILTTSNFVSAVSAGKYDLGEAVNFSRDRALTAIDMSDGGVIRGTAVETSGQKKSSVAIGIGLGGSADRNVLSAVDDAVDKAVVQSSYDLMPSVVGGNRIVEGGAFLSNSVNARLVGAMASDESTVTAYHQEVKEVMARKAEAERATKSPFDISSPYTFMGSLTRSVANAMLRNKVSGAVSTNTVMGAVADLTGDSVKGLWNTAIADGKDDSYEMTIGSYCETVPQAAEAVGDIYCNQKATISTGYMKNTESDWGDIADEQEYKNFVVAGMDRQATVGVQSADVCKSYRAANAGLFEGLANLFSGFFGECSLVDDDIATGAKYTFSGSNSEVKRYAGYALYDRVSSLMNGSTSKTAMIRERFYAEHPQDNSAAGVIARRSGMTKQEAQVALQYADYLTVIANYNPTTRYAFGGKLQVERPILVEHASQIASELYVVYHGRAEYDDLRGRIQVV